MSFMLLQYVYIFVNHYVLYSITHYCFKRVRERMINPKTNDNVRIYCRDVI